MIKPPFTIMILKNKHQPVTVRITTGLLGFVCIIPLLFAGIGFFISHSTMNDSPGVVSTVRDYSPSKPSDEGISNAPDLIDLNTNLSRDNELDISFGFSNLAEDAPYYIWLIVNPDAETVGEKVVYPRSPMFRGMPVDFRNGIEYRNAAGKHITLSLPDETAGIEIKKFRIFAFNESGSLVIDKHYAELMAL
ncbi:hypothetical protein ES708_12573 [subsurface metagenome]